MKYWIFQSNQVLGPYEPEELGKSGTFTAESLVCPEGRRGTSMGDWQRAGMVPDLSVSLVRANQAGHGGAATLAGLPPEPTLRDLAVLGTLKEKMTTLEEAVIQLQGGLRAKDGELAALRQELSNKEQETSGMKEKSSATQQQADSLQKENEDFKRKIAELESRLADVGRLSETVERALEAERHVENDVETQGAALGALTKEIETLKTEMRGRPVAQAGALPPAPLAPMPTMAPPPGEPAPLTSFEAGPAEFPDIAPLPSAATQTPHVDGSLPPEPQATFGSMAPSTAPVFTMAHSGYEAATPMFDAPPDASAAAAPNVDAAPAPKKKTALLFGAFAGLVALAAVAVLAPRFLKAPAKTPSGPSDMTDSTPLQTPASGSVSSGTPGEPAGAAPSPSDPRQSAIEAAKGFALPDGRTLGSALESLSPPKGNLPPWMAEPMPNGHAVVNYFAHGAPGSPTVAYEFEVDPSANSVTGRNTAAKAVLAGKASPPPAPPRNKPVKVKPKSPAKTKPASVAKPEESLDSLLGGDASGENAGPALPAAAAAKPAAAKRAAKTSTKKTPTGGKASGKAADEALLDDLLKE